MDTAGLILENVISNACVMAGCQYGADVELSAANIYDLTLPKMIHKM